MPAPTTTTRATRRPYGPLTGANRTGAPCDRHEGRGPHPHAARRPGRAGRRPRGAGRRRAGRGPAPPGGVAGGRDRRQRHRRHPGPAQGFAVPTFGTNDKPVLVGSILVVLVLLALVTGALAVRRRGAGLAGVAVLGLVGAAAAATRPEADSSTRCRRSPARPPARSRSSCCCAHSTSTTGAPLADESRRQVLVGLLAAGSVAAVAGTFGRLVTRRREGVTASRAAVRLPAPMAAAEPLPPGTELKVKRPLALHDAERRLLPDRHRAGRAAGAHRGLGAEGARHG